MASQNDPHLGCDYTRLHEDGGRAHGPGNTGAGKGKGMWFSRRTSREKHRLGNLDFSPQRY